MIRTSWEIKKIKINLKRYVKKYERIKDFDNRYKIKKWLRLLEVVKAFKGF